MMTGLVMKPAFLVVALSFCAHGHAVVCDTDTVPGGTLPSHWQAYRVAASVVDAGSYLLGLAGERVLVGVETVPGARQGGTRVRVDETWVDRVDWAAHQFTVRVNEPVATLYFDTDRVGKRRFCRIETQELVRPEVIDDDDENDGKPTVLQHAELQLSEIARHRYDANDQLVAVDPFYLDEESKTWKIGLYATCFQHTAAGNLASIASVTLDCEKLKQEDIHTRYVYDVQDRLLRTIYSEFRTEMENGQSARVRHPVVDVFDDRGELIAIYKEDVDRSPYRWPRMPATQSGVLDDVWALDNNRPNFQWLDFGNVRRAGVKWEVRAAPTNEALSRYGRDEWLLVAKGVTNKKSMVDFGVYKKAVQAALQDARKVVIFTADQRSILLVPEVGKAVWQSCQNFENNTPVACP